MKGWTSFAAVHARTLAAWLVSVCCLAVPATEAAELRVDILPQYHSAPLPLDKLSLTNSSGQTFSVSRLDFLLSNFALHRQGSDWLQKTNWHAFLSIAEQRTHFVVKGIPPGDYDRIRFDVGVPAEINHGNPAQYAADHPLNANLNNLHWTWAAGYIFFAIEGHWLEKDESRSGYSFHLGNDAMLMNVELPLLLSISNDALLPLALNVEKIFDFKLSDESSSTHSREGDQLAVRLRENVKRAFALGGARSTALQASAEKTGTAQPHTANLKPYRFTFSSQFPMPDLPRDNPLSEEGVELGQRLFNEKLLSINNQQSCASCHFEENALTDPGKKFSLGAEGKAGTRNTMPIYNLAWKKSFFWDGRAPSIRKQVLEPIQNPVEMHETLDRVVGKLSKDESYPAKFEKVFGTREVTAERVALALEQFLLTKLSFDSKFDRALSGKGELTEEEKRGFQLFVTEYEPRVEQYGADCFHCHGGPFFTTHGFANNGLDAEFVDLGRHDVTKNEGDKGKFFVPSLRNVELTGPYMHDGRFETLEEVIEHYSSGVKRSATLDPNIAKHPVAGIQLSAEDKKALVAFLKTLTDEKYKSDAKVPVNPLESVLNAVGK